MCKCNATLGNFDHSGWVLVECKVGDQGLVKVAALNPETAPVAPLELEFEENKNVVLSVHGQNSVHLSGYYICSYNGDYGENSKQATKETSLLKYVSGLPCKPVLIGQFRRPVLACENCLISRVSKDDGAAENNDEKQGDEAKQSKNVQAELQPHIRVLDSDHGENSKQATKEMESNAMDEDASFGLEHTLGGNVVQAASQEENASQTHEDNDAADHIIQQTDPPILVSEDDGTAEDNDEAELQPRIRVLDSGMTIEDLAKGNVGAKIASCGKKVYVKYVCMLSNGDTVDPTGESSTCKFKLGAGEVISGWDLGIDGMRVGGIRRLGIPPHLGYGDVGRGNIPPNAWLNFDIELLKVKSGRKKARKVDFMYVALDRAYIQL
uniref:peptidylprolyl isomerase n=1 Tax=Oryza barthii TaxID=65489 RepID=A0A0D3H3G2_9ORYZ